MLSILYSELLWPLTCNMSFLIQYPLFWMMFSSFNWQSPCVPPTSSICCHPIGYRVLWIIPYTHYVNLSLHSLYSKIHVKFRPLILLLMDFFTPLVLQPLFFPLQTLPKILRAGRHQPGLASDMKHDPSLTLESPLKMFWINPDYHILTGNSRLFSLT